MRDTVGTMRANAHDGWRTALVGAVPANARRILWVDGAPNLAAQAVQGLLPDRSVMYWRAEEAGAINGLLQPALVVDGERVSPAPEVGSLDCIVYADVLEPLREPVSFLGRHRRLLAPGGCIVASFANAQHHDMLAGLLTGHGPGLDTRTSDRPPERGLSLATVQKLLLDAGFAPALVATVGAPCPPAFVRAARPLIEQLGLNLGRVEQTLGVTAYIVKGTPYADAGPAVEAAEQMGTGTSKTRSQSPFAPESMGTGTSKTRSQSLFAPAAEALTFVVCVSDEAILRANLLASPDLAAGTPHEVIALPGRRSAADGLNEGLARARHGLVVCLHQDVYLPRGWAGHFVREYRRAVQKLGPLGVTGVYGVARGPAGWARTGHVVDRERLLREPPALPARVQTLDEVLLAVPKEAGLRFEPQLGFHFYGADLCLEARRRGLGCAAVDALCFHNSRSGGVGESFYQSGALFAAKWARELPLATSCAVVDALGRVGTW